MTNSFNEAAEADLARALRAAGHSLPDADPRPVVAAADAALLPPSDLPFAQRLVTGQGRLSRAEIIAQCIIQLALEDRALPGGEADPHLPLRRWAVDQSLCTQEDLVAVWVGRLLRLGQALGWLPAEYWDDLHAHIGDDPFMESQLEALRRGEGGTDA